MNTVNLTGLHTPAAANRNGAGTNTVKPRQDLGDVFIPSSRKRQSLVSRLMSFTARIKKPDRDLEEQNEKNTAKLMNIIEDQRVFKQPDPERSAALYSDLNLKLEKTLEKLAPQEKEVALCMIQKRVNAAKRGFYSFITDPGTTLTTAYKDYEGNERFVMTSVLSKYRELFGDIRHYEQRSHLWANYGPLCPEAANNNTLPENFPKLYMEEYQKVEELLGEDPELSNERHQITMERLVRKGRLDIDRLKKSRMAAELSDLKNLDNNFLTSCNSDELTSILLLYKSFLASIPKFERKAVAEDLEKDTMNIVNAVYAGIEDVWNKYKIEW